MALGWVVTFPAVSRRLVEDCPQYAGGTPWKSCDPASDRVCPWTALDPRQTAPTSGEINISVGADTELVYQ